MARTMIESLAGRINSFFRLKKIKRFRQRSLICKVRMGKLNEKLKDNQTFGIRTQYLSRQFY